MSVNVTTPVTGSAQTGLTSPTYTLTTDVAPDFNGKQWAVTALGGTQTGVNTHSVASPFTIAFWKPKLMKLLGSPNNAGVIVSVPSNVYKLVTRKGVIPLAGQPARPMVITTTAEIPAGSDSADAPNIRAAFSAHLGALQQQSAGFGDTAVTGIP